jgi:predicted TIM-barrel fold metal-dependent hydrolase
LSSSEPAAAAPKQVAPQCIVDATLHPAIAAGDDLRSYMPRPWRDLPLPPAERQLYNPGLGGREPVTNPKATAEAAFAAGVGIAILLPLTRGLLVDPNLGAGVAAGTNDWLNKTWLQDDLQVDFRGSIRVDPTDPDLACREIERWSGNPKFVQLAVPLGTGEPYGHPRYWPIWEAAAKHGLPVAVHLDGGGGAELPPTAMGYPLVNEEYNAFYPMHATAHLASLIGEGVFERFENLRFVFADGGLGMFAPILWRLDKEWKSWRWVTPWVEKNPSQYAREHVRLVIGAGDLDLARGPGNWLMPSETAAAMVMYGSSLGDWDYVPAADARSAIPEPIAAALLARNACDLYKLAEPRC